MLLLNDIETVTAHVIQSTDRALVERITKTFDGYVNNALPGEVILDTCTLSEDPDAEAEAIALFGQEVWDKIPSGLVLFHG